MSKCGVSRGARQSRLRVRLIEDALRAHHRPAAGRLRAGRAGRDEVDGGGRELLAALIIRPDPATLLRMLFDTYNPVANPSFPGFRQPIFSISPSLHQIYRVFCLGISSP